jgi:hypothetical protein
MRRPWTAGLLIGAMAIVQGLVGCFSAPATRNAVAVPPNLKALSVFLDAPATEFVLPPDTDCSINAVRSQVLAPLRRMLTQAGYQTVAAPEVADVHITVGAVAIACDYTGSAPAEFGYLESVRLSARVGNKIVFDSEASGESEPLPTNLLSFKVPISEVNGFGNFQGRVENWPADLTNALTKALTEKGIVAGIAAANVAAASPEAGSSSASSPKAPSSNASSAMPKLLAGQARPNAYALVVGVEKYRDAPATPGARTDATRFAQLVTTTLGVPSDHVLVALDERASKGDLDKHLDWLTKNVTAGGRVYFYFAGHGAADAGNGSAYLMPHDADPKAIGSTGVALSSVLSRLSATKAESVVAFVDSCFSGEGGRSVLPPGARPLMQVAAPSATQSPRVALLSSAGASEISGPTADGAQGLFTSLLVEGVGTGAADFDGDGNLSIGEIAGWVGPRVTREAKKASRDQTPVLTLGNAVGAADKLVVVTALAK